MDELNSPVEQVVEPRNIIPIDQFFDEMYLTESEKEERKELAKNIFIILSAILTIIKANEVLKNSHDTQEYKGYVADNLKSLFRGVFGSDKYNSQIDNFADEFIDSTMRNIDTPYFTSVDRATVNAEQQSNAIYNQNQYEEAIRTGKTKKRWITMHDKRVRKTHDEADGQEVDIDKPFEVGSSELMFPCDLSLGASLKEICNCRCVVAYSGNKDEDTEGISEIPNLNYNLRYEKQREHIEGTAAFNRRKATSNKEISYFVEGTTLEDIERIVEQLKDAEKISRPDSTYPISYGNIENAIGRVYNNNENIKDYVATNRVKLIYSSKGVHVYPVKNW